MRGFLATARWIGRVGQALKGPAPLPWTVQSSTIWNTRGFQYSLS
jgi:hypothetical protein